MGWSLAWWRRAACVALLGALIGLATVLPVQAQGGFALSGSFYAQQLELPQGATLAAPDVYLVVFNNTDHDLQVRMTPKAPLGVNLVLAETEFALRAGEQRKLEVGIQVAPDTAPGDYEISVTAEPYRSGVRGIQITGGAGQTAKLRVTGEGAQVTAQVVSPEGVPLAGMARLLKVRSGQRFEVAYSETGLIEALVSPGSYVAEAYVAGEKLAEEAFEVAAGENKQVSLTASTVYFEDFSLVPNYRSGTQELAFVQIVYTLRNLYKPMGQSEIILHVSHEGRPLDDLVLASMNPLDIGRVGLRYSYAPVDGLQQGTYRFALELIVDGESRCVSREESLAVEAKARTSVRPWDRIGWVSAVAVLGVVVGLGGVGYARLSKRRTGDREEQA